MNMPLSTISRTLIVFLLAGWLAPVSAAPREVRCESHSLRHAYCPVGEHGVVKLLRTHGVWGCVEGKSWGTDGNGIWVDNGCKGEFWVEDTSRNHHSGRNAAIAAGLIGAVVLAAVISNSKKGDAGEHESLPLWMIGTYHGYNPELRVESILDVGANGQVFSRAATHTAHGTYTGNSTVQWDDGSTSRVEQTPRGFKLISSADSDRVVEYYRGR